MKEIIRKLSPPFLLKLLRKIRRYLRQQTSQHISIEQVFTEIYTQNKWGGESGAFCSGSGTHDREIVKLYVDKIAELAIGEGFQGLSFVDLGCGDFSIGKQLVNLCERYLGVDIVLPLIDYNQRNFGDDKVSFQQLDLVNDELPPADVCFVRQVFQHLSNQQIAAIIAKLKIYRWVFITEHYPSDNDRIEPNIDKVHGGDIRLFKNSGVYLTAPPFNLPELDLTKVLEVLGHDHQQGEDRGIIRTFLYKPESRLER